MGKVATFGSAIGQSVLDELFHGLAQGAPVKRPGSLGVFDRYGEQENAAAGVPTESVRTLEGRQGIVGLPGGLGGACEPAAISRTSLSAATLAAEWVVSLAMRRLPPT